MSVGQARGALSLDEFRTSARRSRRTTATAEPFSPPAHVGIGCPSKKLPSELRLGMWVRREIALESTSREQLAYSGASWTQAGTGWTTSGLQGPAGAVDGRRVRCQDELQLPSTIEFFGVIGEGMCPDGGRGVHHSQTATSRQVV